MYYFSRVNLQICMFQAYSVKKLVCGFTNVNICKYKYLQKLFF